MALQSQLQQKGCDSCGEDDVEPRGVLCLVEVEEQSVDSSFLDSDVCVEDCIKVEVDTADEDEDYSNCIVLDIAPESSSQALGCKGEHLGSNGDGLLPKVFHRQASLKTGKTSRMFIVLSLDIRSFLRMSIFVGFTTALFLFHDLRPCHVVDVLLPGYAEKPPAEKANDSSNNKWRKYKRAA